MEESVPLHKQVKAHHVFGALLVVALLVAFHFRVKLIERFEHWRNSRRWVQLQTDEDGFRRDLEDGFSSGNFDVTDNIRSGDTRTLDHAAKKAIRAAMEKDNLSFDAARLQYFQGKMRDNGIDSEGVPTDPRTVTFS